MDINDAIRAHSQWKTKLAAYLSKPDHSLNPSTVGADNQCVLGQWLHGEGRKHAKLPEYSKLVSDHAHFHKAAANVIRKADSGQSVAHEVALGSHSEFTSASAGVVQSLMAMRAKL